MDSAKPAFRVYAASDSYGATLRSAMVSYLRSRGIEVEDYGEDKYYTAAERVAKSVAADRSATDSPACDTRGLLVCGTGTGVTVFANKIPTTSPEKGQEIVDAWLATEFKAPCPASGNQPWNKEVFDFLTNAPDEMAAPLVSSYLLVQLSPASDLHRPSNHRRSTVGWFASFLIGSLLGGILTATIVPAVLPPPPSPGKATTAFSSPIAFIPTPATTAAAAADGVSMPVSASADAANVAATAAVTADVAADVAADVDAVSNATWRGDVAGVQAEAEELLARNTELRRALGKLRQTVMLEARTRMAELKSILKEIKLVQDQRALTYYVDDRGLPSPPTELREIAALTARRRPDVDAKEEELVARAQLKTPFLSPRPTLSSPHLPPPPRLSLTALLFLTGQVRVLSLKEEIERAVHADLRLSFSRCAAALQHTQEVQQAHTQAMQAYMAAHATLSLRLTALSALKQPGSGEKLQRLREQPILLSSPTARNAFLSSLDAPDLLFSASHFPSMFLSTDHHPSLVSSMQHLANAQNDTVVALKLRTERAAAEVKEAKGKLPELCHVSASWVSPEGADVSPCSLASRISEEERGGKNGTSKGSGGTEGGTGMEKENDPTRESDPLSGPLAPSALWRQPLWDLSFPTHSSAFPAFPHSYAFNSPASSPFSSSSSSPFSSLLSSASQSPGTTGSSVAGQSTTATDAATGDAHTQYHSAESPGSSSASSSTESTTSAAATSAAAVNISFLIYTSPPTTAALDLVSKLYDCTHGRLRAGSIGGRLGGLTSEALVLLDGPSIPLHQASAMVRRGKSAGGGGSGSGNNSSSSSSSSEGIPGTVPGFEKYYNPADWIQATRRTSPGSFLTHILAPSRMGAARAYNLLSLLARGSILVLLAGGDLPPDSCDWAANLVAPFSAWPRLGIAGHSMGKMGLRNAPGSLQLGEVRNAGDQFWNRLRDPVTGVRMSFVLGTVTGPMAARRDVFVKVGGFSTIDGGIDALSDWDLCQHVWLSGHQVALVYQEPELRFRATDELTRSREMARSTELWSPDHSVIHPNLTDRIISEVRCKMDFPQPKFPARIGGLSWNDDGDDSDSDSPESESGSQGSGVGLLGASGEIPRSESSAWKGSRGGSTGGGGERSGSLFGGAGDIAGIGFSGGLSGVISGGISGASSGGGGGGERKVKFDTPDAPPSITPAAAVPPPSKPRHSRALSSEAPDLLAPKPNARRARTTASAIFTRPNQPSASGSDSIPQDPFRRQRHESIGGGLPGAGGSRQMLTPGSAAAAAARQRRMSVQFASGFSKPTGLQLPGSVGGQGGPMTPTAAGNPSTATKKVQKSMMMCMDPTCNACPPEMHALRNKKLMAQVIDEFPEPLARPTRRGGRGGGRGGGGDDDDDSDYDFDDDDDDDDDDYGYDYDAEQGQRTIVRFCGITCFAYISKPKRKKRKSRWTKAWEDVRDLFQPISMLWQPWGILNPHSKFMARWNKVFMVACILGFTIDPWFLFTLQALHQVAPEPAMLCLTLDWTAAIAFTVLRSFVDLCYVIQIVVQFRMAYIVPPPTNRKNRFFRRWWADRSLQSPGDLEFDARVIASRYLRSWFLIDVLAALPIPQIVMLVIVPMMGRSVPSNTGVAMTVLCLAALFAQNVPRAIRFFPILSGNAPHVTGLVFETAWANFLLNFVFYLMASNIVGSMWYFLAASTAWAYFLLNFVFYLMASNVVGSMWYFLAASRFTTCMAGQCATQGGACQPEYMYCVDQNSIAYQNTAAEAAWATGPASACLVADTPGSDAPPSPIDYGIFTNAVPLVVEGAFLSKYIYSFFWGFQQVSTLAGNLEPSRWDPEVLFVILVIGLGLVLLALLIGNISNFLQALSRRSFEYQLQRHDIDSWMERRNLPLSLQKRVQKQQRLHWVATRGVEEAEVLDKLSDDIQTDVRRSLCLELLQCSALFFAMEPQVLDAFCEKLRQQLYIEGTVILKEGYPVSRLFFVLRGQLESYTTIGGRAGFVDSVLLGKGDFLGEELLVEYLEKLSDRDKSRRSGPGIRYLGRSVTMGASASASAAALGTLAIDVLPTAQRTVRCIGPVEGYELEATDVAVVCRQFARMLSTSKIQAALNECCHNRRTHAARTIQLAWRRHLRKKYGLTIQQVMSAVNQNRMQLVVRKALELQVGGSGRRDSEAGDSRNSSRRM
ncbi:unnamed protein product [Closterium sp. Yama58-4]|nr:unnamed protein product [Closterium sp. Yama58-4]